MIHQAVMNIDTINAGIHMPHKKINGRTINLVKLQNVKTFKWLNLKNGNHFLNKSA